VIINKSTAIKELVYMFSCFDFCVLSVKIDFEVHQVILKLFV